MPIKLLDILKNEISEQGLYRKNTILPTGKKVGDVVGAIEFDNKGGFIKYIDPKDVGSKTGDYDEDVTYDEDSLLTYAPIPKAEKEAGIINPNLISDIIKALRICGIPAEISYSKGNHRPTTNSGNLSNHSTGNAVDLSVINGVGNSGGNGSNKGIGNAKFMADGDKIVSALEKLGYTFGESASKMKGYLWRTNQGGNHWNHIHVSNKDREVKLPKKSPEETKVDPKEKKPEETKTNKKDEVKTTTDKKTITGKSYIIDLNDPESKNIGLIWGGTPSSSAGASFMKKEGEPYFKNKNIIYSNYEKSISDIKDIIKKELGGGYTIKSVSGFSKGGEETWRLRNSYSFVGLIDPSIPESVSRLPNSVKMMSNSDNWSKYKDTIQKYLIEMEKNKSSEKVSDGHYDIPKKFFKKYSSYF